MGSGSSRAARGGRACLLALAASATASCAVFDLLEVRRAEQTVAQYAHVSGNVATQSPSEHPLIVLILRLDCEDWRSARAAVEEHGVSASGAPPPEVAGLLERLRSRVELVAHVVREQPGLWYARVAPGCYGVAAFEDANEDGRYEDEPALRAWDPRLMLELAPGDRRRAVDLVKGKQE